MHDGLLGGFQLKKIQKLGTLLRLLLPIMAAAAAACYRTAAARLLRLLGRLPALLHLPLGLSPAAAAALLERHGG